MAEDTLLQYIDFKVENTVRLAWHPVLELDISALEFVTSVLELATSVLVTFPVRDVAPTLALAQYVIHEFVEITSDLMI